jgi:hypothetical protein
VASNSKRSRDDNLKTKFTEAEKNWNLEKLYEDLRAAKRKVLTDTEKCHLRGLLCGYSPQEIADERVIAVGTVNDALSKTLYCYIEDLLDYEKEIRHWSDVPDFLEKAGYKIQVSEQFQLSHPLLDKNENTLEISHQSEAAVNASAKELTAERRVDYSRLRDLLAAGKWRDADRETGTVMLKAASKVRQGWLRSDDIKKFPCTDLQIIDSLWGKYSHGRFGFSIQKRILLDIGGTNDADLQTFHAFADSVGWRVEGVWVARVKHTIDAPEGHLPDLDFGISPHYVEGFRAARGLGHDGAWNARRTILSALVSKLADCNIR